MRDITSYSANQVTRRLGEGAVIWIDPARIMLSATHIRSRRPKNLGKILDRLGITNRKKKGGIHNLLYRNRFAIAQEDFRNIGPFEETMQYRNASDYARNLDDVRKTQLFREIREAIATEGKYRYKNEWITDVEDIPRFFDRYWGNLYNSMLSSGYDASRADDIGKCYVATDGQLIKGENARHRLAVARLTGVRSFPLLVFGVSENWYRDRVGDALDKPRLLEKLKEVEAGYQA